MSTTSSARPHALTRSLKRAAAALTATLVAAPLAAAVSAAPASAATVATWDRLARCESSGNWSINTGNGYYGGLQFSLSSWRWVGGSGYPHRASKAEQIRRAELLLARQGWGAWPACSRKLGLTKADARATERASRSTQRAAAPKAAAPARTVVAPKAAAVRTSGQVVVRRGDTLSSIAARNGVKGGWKALYAANRSVIANPNLIRVGWTLKLPA